MIATCMLHDHDGILTMGTISEFHKQIRKGVKGSQLRRIAGTLEHGQFFEWDEGSNAAASRFATALQPCSMHLSSISRACPTLHAALSRQLNPSKLVIVHVHALLAPWLRRSPSK